MTLTSTPTSHAGLAERRRLGWTYVAAAGSWVGYLALALTVANGYETALEEASAATDTPVNRLPADVLAEIARDHPGSVVTSLLIYAVPAILVLAARRTRAVTGAAAPELLAWVSAAVLWTYFTLTVGLYAGPDHLPPLTRDLDVLTVPMVSAGSVLALLAFVAAAWSLHRHGWRPVASAVAAAIAAGLLVLSVVASVGSGWDEPVPPVGLLPAELVLGIALVVGTRSRRVSTELS